MAKHTAVTELEVPVGKFVVVWEQGLDSGYTHAGGKRTDPFEYWDTEDEAQAACDAYRMDNFDADFAVAETTHDGCWYL